jgi:hypothetical protein
MRNNEFYRLIEIERAAHRQPSHFAMDEAFCARMRAAMAAGLESAPTSVITMPGTKSPKYVSELTAKYHRPRDER